MNAQASVQKGKREELTRGIDRGVGLADWLDMERQSTVQNSQGSSTIPVCDLRFSSGSALDMQ